VIREAAYFLAQGRGFRRGHELADWLATEEQIGLALIQDETATALGS
jgi:hypothetical protein